jgi:DNA polymerase III sliding clamp (beta) subunit (PCNA family)
MSAGRLIEFELSNLGLIRDSFRMISAIADEAPLKFTGQGVYVRVLDLSEVSMIDLFIPKEVFETYSHSQDVSVNVRAGDMLKFLKGTKGGEKSKVWLEENKINFRLSGGVTKFFSIPVFQSEQKELPLPRVELENSFVTNISVIKGVLDSGRGISDNVSISVSGSKVMISVESELSRYGVELSTDEGTISDQKLKEGSAAKYDLTRLGAIVTSTPQTEAKISFGTAKPLKIEINFPGGGAATFFLAPRVE